MTRDGGSHRAPSSQRPTPRPSTGRPGTRFKNAQGTPAPTPAGSAPRLATARRAATYRAPAHAARGHVPVTPARSQGRRAATRRRSKKTSPLPILAGLALIAVMVALVVFIIGPAVGNMLGLGGSSVEPGQEVQITIAEGASGDDIAQVLAQNHIIDNPKDYYAAVNEMDAASSIKPGDYLLTTGMEPKDVVAQLVEGPNVEGNRLTVQEGLTVTQTAARVEEAFGISSDEFLAQAKASNYVADYPFLEGAYNDSLEGYLYPKTYTFDDVPTADEVIRKLLDQFVKETSALNLDAGTGGLSAQQIVTMASLIERETAVEDERPLVASVIYNRLAADMPLQIDAAIVYARGGGSDPVTYSDLEIDSPYNVYKNYGLTPGPICSPSVSSIQAAISPADTDYLYYVASPDGDGTHRFSSDYAQFEQDSEAYAESQQ